MPPYRKKIYAMDFEKYKDRVSPELMEKIKAAKSDDEIMELLQQEKIELTPDELQAVAGGAKWRPYPHP